MQYKSLFIIGFFLIIIFSNCEKSCDKIQYCNEFEHDGMMRNYLLYLPENIQENAALIFVLHGYTGTAERLMEHSKFNALADKHGFVVCYPKGVNDKYRNSHWDADLEISETDDVGFLSNLAKALQEKYELNVNRTFVCGMSNGGYMSYTLACRASKTFRAVASVTGTMSEKTWNDCENAASIPILQIHGIADDVVPIDGSMTTDDGWGNAPKMDSIMDFWANKNHCLIKDTTFVTSKTNAYLYQNCVDSNEVWYYKIEDYGHSWPVKEDANFEASEVIWTFFSQF
ncbi:MAG: PHB depolymerase family esterase [Saprospiraceae bacterium]